MSSASPARKRSDRVPLPPAIGNRSTSGRSAGWSGPAAALTTSSRVLAVNRSMTDRPLESTSVAPVTSTPAEASLLVTASTAPAKLSGRPVAFATSRAMVSAITLSEAFIIWRSRSISGADCTAASCRPPGGPGAKVTVAGSTRNAVASARPASNAGVVERRDSSVVGWVRPASTITAWIGAMSPPSMSAGSHPGAKSGPENSDMSTCTAVGVIPLRRTWSARSLIRAAPRYQESWPGGAADSTGSPPPTSTTTPG